MWPDIKFPPINLYSMAKVKESDNGRSVKDIARQLYEEKR